MKTWKDLSGVAMPDRIAALPRDARGYPIQVTAGKGTDGSVDFRAIDMIAWVRCIKTRRCGICGQPMGRHVAFVGGPRSMQARAFMDVGMHLDCARYACQVCPFLAAPKFAYSRATPQLPGNDMHVSNTVSTERPAYFGLGVATQYRVVPNGPDDVAILASEWVSTEWWKEGVRYEHKPK